MEGDGKKWDAPWEPIAWPEDQQQSIFRDWGIFYEQRLRTQKAFEYFTKSLELKPHDTKVLQLRSKCQRDLADIENALVDSETAAKIDPHRQPIALEIVDALYEMNRFEDNKRILHDNTHKFTGRKVKAFNDRLDVVNGNFKDSLGDSLGPFIFKSGHCFAAVLRDLYLKNHIDQRPLWKILKEQGKCDVESVIEKTPELLSPLELARRERAFNVFNQIYFNRNWIDVLFLKMMRKNKDLLLPEFVINTPILEQLTRTNYDILWKFMKMLQARSPLYNERYVKCRNKVLCKKYLESILYRIQHQTRRTMINILRTIRILRTTGNLSRLTNFVEEVMGDYLVLKTHRIMPWKFEFLNEVYNTLALARTDCLLVTPTTTKNKCSDDLLEILQLDIGVQKNRPLDFVFGDRSSHHTPDAGDNAQLRYRAFLARLENRMHFAKHKIERSYLYHEIARAHLEKSRFEECCSSARKGVKEAKLGNSNIWGFLCTMLIVKSHAILHKVERCKEELEKAHVFAEAMYSPELCAYIKLCSTYNDRALALKKRSQSTDQVRKRSKYSMKGSTNSLTSQKYAPSNSSQITI